VDDRGGPLRHVLEDLAGDILARGLEGQGQIPRLHLLEDPLNPPVVHEDQILEGEHEPPDLLRQFRLHLLEGLEDPLLRVPVNPVQDLGDGLGPTDGGDLLGEDGRDPLFQDGLDLLHHVR